ncbi:MAG: hypothetical protein ACK5HT_12520 [Draconibacterium sp.]
MNKKAKTATNWLAAAVFLAALALNAKVTLDDPFVLLSDEAVAQTTTGSGNDGYETKEIKVGDNLKETATIGGNIYTRTCKFRETSCSGEGSIDCTPGLYTYSCTPWKKQE